MKNVFFVMLSLCVFSFSFAQNEPTKDFKSSKNPELGIKGGINLTNLYTEDVDDNNVLFSFNAGLYANLPLSDKLSIQPEFLFSRKGAELQYDNAFVTGTSKFKLNYLEIPILVKLNLTDNFNIHFGPYVAYLIDAQITNETSGGSFDFEEDLDTDDFNKFDYGLSAGAGLDFDGMSIGLRYNYGLSTIGKERDFAGSTYTFPDAKNSVLSLYLSVKL